MREGGGRKARDAAREGRMGVATCGNAFCPRRSCLNHRKKNKKCSTWTLAAAAAPLVCMGVLGAAAAAAGALVQSFHSINGHLANARAVGVKSVPVWNLHVFITGLLPTLHNSGQQISDIGTQDSSASYLLRPGA